MEGVADRATEPNKEERLEARSGIEPPMRVLQTHALPLGYRAIRYCTCRERAFKQETHLPESLAVGRKSFAIGTAC